jgi:hypothetical protein
VVTILLIFNETGIFLWFVVRATGDDSLAVIPAGLLSINVSGGSIESGGTTYPTALIMEG